MYGDAQVRQYLPDGNLTRAQAQEELDCFRHGHPDNAALGLRATLARDSGRLVGRCGLLPWQIEGRDEVELAYLIDRRQWGQGLATEAAAAIVEHARNCLGLRRLVSLILPANLASIRVAEKIGMSHERDCDVAGSHCRLCAPDR